jgi:predicted HTH transcriptional regulator
MIEIFDDRIEISNPGGLPAGLTAQSFGTKSVVRNPIIAALLLRAGYIEKIGYLKKQRIVKRIGPAKGGYWDVVENYESK